MTNRSDGKKCSTTGRPPDGDWKDTKCICPTWMGNEARNTVYSGIEFTKKRHGPLPPQSEGWKQHADDDTLLEAYADIPTNTGNMPWDGPHKRILFESDDPESDGIFCMKHRRFTNTALPVFSGAECWFQHFHIVQAIVKETATLQLFAHVKGEALNVALLLTKEKRESWTGLVNGLSAYYQSPSRLADLRRRFESAFRQPGLDPATFATDLGILAIQWFEDIKKQARDTMIRDKFIAGQEQCALRRQLDGLAQDTRSGKLWIVIGCGKVIQMQTESPL